MPVTPDGFDLDMLLAPIDGPTSVGADLREDFSAQSIYFRLRDARSEARAAERAADADPDASGDSQPPQWRTVRELSSKALETLTKDLEVASWYTEALVRSNGLDGLAAGAKLIDGLASGFWESGLFPVPDEDGIATLVAPITGLNGQGSDGTLIQPLRKLVLCRRPSGDPLYYYQYEDAVTVAGIADPVRRDARLSAGSFTFDDVDGWARGAGQAFFATQYASATEALAAWEAMSNTLDGVAGQDSPSTGKVRDLLREIVATIGKYCPSGVAAAPEPMDDDSRSDAYANPVQPGGMPQPAAGRSVTREDMLRDIARIAEWFRKNEPQSPIAYTLDDAVRRGRMTLPDLLAELVGDPGSRHAILTSLGIKPPPDEG